METRISIGKPHNRIDGPLKATGRAPYAADYPAADLVHGVIVSSSIASGRITAIDTSAARRIPGVIDVLSHVHRPHMSSNGVRYKDTAGPPGTPYRPLFDERVLFAGQPVALVLAETYEAARDAAALVDVRYEEASFETDLAKVEAASYEPKTKRSGVSPPPASRGHAAAAYAESTHKVEAVYLTSPEYHNAMELFATTVVWHRDETLTVYDKTQGSQNVHLYLTLALGMRRKDSTVVNAYVGGAFGSGLRPSHGVFLATFAARHLKRSVRIVLTRSQMFAMTSRPQAIQSLSLACDAHGHLQAVRHHAVAATSTYEDQQEVVVNWSGLAYTCANADFSYQLAKLSTPTPGDMRAPGAATGTFALECAMDELAVASSIDPVQLRLANWIDRDQNQDLPITSKALRECYEQAGAHFRWSERRAEPRSMRDGRELIGWGMAGGAWDAGLAPLPTRARVTWRTDGRLEVAAGASDIGTGTYTILAQIAAEAFGIPVGGVDVRLGDSTLPLNPVEGGSWMAATTGAAVAKACESLKSTLLRKAYRLAGMSRRKSTVAFEGGRLKGERFAADGLSIEDILREHGRDIAETATILPPLFRSKHVSYAHSAVYAEVRIDEELGVLRATRIVIAVAAGRILNPKTARSQVLGSVVMGVGKALHEEGVYDHRFGKVMNHSFADYHVPTNADIFDIDAIFVEEHDDEVSPLGVKGVGEVGIVAVAPAIANAIYHATGRRIRSIPITVDKVLGLT